MNDLLHAFIAAVLGSILGGGALWKAAGAVLEVRMRKIAEAEVNKIGTRLNAYESLAIQIRESTDHNSDRLTVLEERDRQRWEGITREITEHVLKPLEQITERLNEISLRQERHTAEIAGLEKRFDRR